MDAYIKQVFTSALFVFASSLYRSFQEYLFDPMLLTIVQVANKMGVFIRKILHNEQC